MTDITNSDSMFACGCRIYRPGVMWQLDYCEDHGATGETMKALRSELAELKQRHSQAIKRNLELRKLYNDAMMKLEGK